LRTRSILQPRVGAVLALVEPALSGQVEGVHDFRVAARSLRAALRTLLRKRESGFARRVRKALQVATQALAGPRDRDVGRSLLIKRSPASADDAGYRRRVTGLAESHRRLALTRSVRLWPRDLDRLLIRLLHRGETPVEVVIRRGRAEAWRQRRRAIEALNALGRRYDAIRLHDLRRRVRSLRYAIEVLSEVDSTASARAIRLKPLQSALGDIQDLIVLSRWLATQASRFRRRDPSFAAALRQDSARFRAKSVAAHAAFLKLRPAAVLERLALHVDPHAALPPLPPRTRGKRTRASTEAPCQK